MENPQNQTSLHHEHLEQLKASYQARNQEIAKGFTQALTSVQTSQVLQVMKGAEMLPWCLQHIQEITTQILNSQAEQSLRQSLRTTSELKAQMAILRMELQLAKKKQNTDKRAKQLQQQVEQLRAELVLQKQKSANIKLAEIVDKEIQNRIKTIEQEYILKAEHERIIQDLQRQMRQTARTDTKNVSKQQESEELLKRIITEKYEQTLRRQSEKYEAEIQLLKGRIRLLEKDITLSSHSRHQNSHNHNLTRVLSNVNLRKQSRMERLTDSEKEEKETPFKLSEHLPSKEFNKDYHSKPPLSMHGANHAPRISSPHRGQVKGYQQPEKPQHTLDRHKSSAKFEDIQASFAKELAELRQRMSLKRERLGSPDLIHNRLRPTLREDNSRRRLYGSPSDHILPGYTKN